MRNASDTVFTFESDIGVSRVILSGAADQVEKILKAYYSR